MAELRLELFNSGFNVWGGVGKGDTGDWPPEPSFLVLGISREVATQLAAHHEQCAYVFGEVGAPAELVWTAVVPQ